MDPRQLEALATRLGENPGDTEALSAAYNHGLSDPRGYAVFLEKAGALSRDAVTGAHWFCEAATVWTTSLNDAHRAARALMNAVDKDPAGAVPAERLSALYREKGDVKGIAALQDRRAKNLERTLAQNPEARSTLAAIYVELARLWSEELGQIDKALDAYKKAAEHEPSDVYSIYQARELLKTAGRFAEALPWFAAEQRWIEADPVRQLALYLDEAEVAAQAGNQGARLQALRAARGVDTSDDPGLKQQLGAVILERIQAGQAVSRQERDEARDLFLSLAETYDGEYGYSYASCALECDGANDRAAQLVMYYGQLTGKGAEMATPIAGYLAENPAGLLATEARALLAETFAATGDDSLLAALTPADGAPPEQRALAFADLARSLASRGRLDEAAEHYRKVIELEPAQEEAVDFLRGRLRQAGDDAQLRDLLLAGARVETATRDQRLAWLAEAAELCEGPLKDVAGAIEARRQLVLLDPSDDDAAEQLQNVLEKAARWDDWAELMTRRAEVAPDRATQLERERALVAVHRDKRKDSLGAAEALGRIARLEPNDEALVLEAIEHFAQASRPELGIELLAELLREALSGATRVAYSEKLGQLSEARGDWVGAGGAYAEAASGKADKALWAQAEACFVRAEAHEQAARSVAEQRALETDEAERGRLFAVEAGYASALGDTEGALSCLKQAVELCPQDDKLAATLEQRYGEARRYGELVQMLLSRAALLPQAQLQKRVALRKQAAQLQKDEFPDEEGRRLALLEVLEDVEDVEALTELSAEAEARGDLPAAADLLRRLEAVVPEAERGALALRLGGILEDQGDDEGALVQYRLALPSQPEHVPLLTSLAVLEQSVGKAENSVALYEKLLTLTSGPEKLAVARNLARIEADVLKRPERAFEAFETVLSLEGDDFAVVERLRDLSERLERWPAFVGFQKQLVEAEGDDATAAALALQLAEVLTERLKQPERAWVELESFAALEDGACRDEYLRLGDQLDKSADVARSLVKWMAEVPAGRARTAGLLAAYQRFVASAHTAEALDVGLELVRQKDADPELARGVERVAAAEKNAEGLLAAFAVLEKDLSGPPRAAEMVRQAEALALAGMSAEEAIQHGEQALTSVPPCDAEALLARLAALGSVATQVIDVYERQITRCKSAEDRLQAMCRAAEVSLAEGDATRARGFYEIAVHGAGTPEALAQLIERVRASDQKDGGQAARALLVEVLEQSGTSARDGGRSRSIFLARAAALAHGDLDQKDRAYQLLTEALVAHVDDEQLEQLESWALADGNLGRAAEVMGAALAEVHDGPLVRQLLRRRFTLRSERLQDAPGALEDLKKLYEISPGDAEVAEKLEKLYVESQDHRGLVHLYEDQILRSKDQGHRAELARKVALLWQDTLENPREAADAWRRVLRMKAGDEEAKSGLERAKTAQRSVTPEQIAKAEEEARAKLLAQEAIEQREREQRAVEEEARRKLEEERIKKSLQDVTAQDEIDEPPDSEVTEVTAPADLLQPPLRSDDRVTPTPTESVVEREDPVAQASDSLDELAERASDESRIATAPEEEQEEEEVVVVAPEVEEAEKAPESGPEEPAQESLDELAPLRDAAASIDEEDTLVETPDNAPASAAEDAEEVLVEDLDDAVGPVSGEVTVVDVEPSAADTPEPPSDEDTLVDVPGAAAPAPSRDAASMRGEDAFFPEDTAPDGEVLVPPPLPASTPRVSVPPPLPGSRPSGSVPPPLPASTPRASVPPPLPLPAAGRPSGPPGPPPRRPSSPPGAASTGSTPSRFPAPPPPPGARSPGKPPLPPPSLAARPAGAPPLPPPAAGGRAPLPPGAPPRKPPPPPPKRG